MANYMADNALNIAADAIVDTTVEIRLHSGAPGNAGTANRIGTVKADVVASGWGTASGGEVDNNDDINFGVLNNSAQTTVRAWSGWRGNQFLGWGDVYAEGTTNVGVAVAANEAFKLNAGTVSFEFTR